MWEVPPPPTELMFYFQNVFFIYHFLPGKQLLSAKYIFIHKYCSAFL